ncbi:MAG: hypothetical protein GF346_00680 [Candidatus Eisenbacteria bacterium]|nr:hypothetical protein [Candidatus Latescibacterota bacterium]MBD3300946.1 hypothetical protein [Candidatus Eisenbacteria bacterium]
MSRAADRRGGGGRVRERSGLDRSVWALLGLGLLIRAVLLPTAGYGPDVAFWKSLLTYTHVFGVQDVYAMETPLQPYPPLFVYLLWGLGHLYTLFFSPDDGSLLTVFVKAPAVAGDLLAALLLARFALRRAGAETLAPLKAAGLLVLHPVLIWISAHWGQVDVLHAAIAAGAWGAALSGTPVLAGILLALGVLMKPQGLIVLPAAVALLLARSGSRGLLRAVAAGTAIFALLLVPFLVAGHARALVDLYAGAAARYPYLSVYAFNPWWIVSLLAGGGRDAALIPDDGGIGALATPRFLGAVLFLAATVWIAARLALRAGAGTFTDARGWRLLTLQWFAFFLLPTHVHERYLVPALLSLAPAVILEPRWVKPYLLLSLCILLNVIYVFPGAPWLLWAARILSGEGVLVALVLSGLALLLVRAEIREGAGDG